MNKILKFIAILYMVINIQNLFSDVITVDQILNLIDDAFNPYNIKYQIKKATEAHNKLTTILKNKSAELKKTLNTPGIIATPLTAAIQMSRDPNFIKLFLDAGASPNTLSTSDGKHQFDSPLLTAITITPENVDQYKNAKELVNLLLSYNADINAIDGTKHTILYNAADSYDYFKKCSQDSTESQARKEDCVTFANYFLDIFTFLVQKGAMPGQKEDLNSILSKYPELKDAYNKNKQQPGKPSTPTPSSSPDLIKELTALTTNLQSLGVYFK